MASMGKYHNSFCDKHQITYIGEYGCANCMTEDILKRFDAEVDSAVEEALSNKTDYSNVMLLALMLLFLFGIYFVGVYFG